MKKLVIIFYGIFLVLFSVFSYFFVDENIPYLGHVYTGLAFSNRTTTTLLYILSIVIFFIFYGIFIFWGIRKKIKTKEVVFLLCMTAAILFFSYPAMLSYDIFNYLATSKVLFFYHENPYLVMPIEFTGDSFLPFMHAANKIALYGPFWIILTGIPYLLGLGNFVLTLFASKLLTTLFYLLTVLIFWKLSKNVVSLILFSLNPLILVEILVSGHNDIAMMFLALLSFFLLTKRKIVLATMFMILSILIKYSTIFLLPVFLYIFLMLRKNKNIDWEKTYYYPLLSMFVIFLLAPLREEIYPWYAVWFLPFSFLISKNKILVCLSISFSFGLLFRYIPYMFFGTHAGFTPLFKMIVTFIPALLVSFYFIYKKICGRKFCQQQ